MTVPVAPFLLATTLPFSSKHSISRDMATTRTVSRWEGRDVVNSPIIRQLKPRSTFLMADAIELTFILALVINCIATPSQSLQDFVSIVIPAHSRDGTYRGTNYRVSDRTRIGTIVCSHGCRGISHPNRKCISTPRHPVSLPHQPLMISRHSFFYCPQAFSIWQMARTHALKMIHDLFHVGQVLQRPAIIHIIRSTRPFTIRRPPTTIPRHCF